MKKATVIITITAILVLIFCSQSSASGKEYPQTFIVSAIDKDADIMYLETFSGMVYTWEGVEDWQLNDIAAAIMNDNGTPAIYDDEILDLKYSGWIE